MIMCRKLGLALLALALLPQLALGQNPHSERRQVEVGLGITTPFLQGGHELVRSRELRSDGRSYFERSNGTRRAVGSYPALLGFSVNLGFLQPVTRAEGLMLGAAARATLTGSQPSRGGYDEGYFFNSVTTTFVAKYYPAAGSNVFLRGEAGIGSVMTKDRFLNDHGEQSYFHQFGIGPAGAVGIGYSLTPFGDGGTLLDVQLVYQQLRTRVEVDGIGDDQWTSGALHLAASLGF